MTTVPIAMRKMFRACYKSYYAARLRRRAVLEILMYFNTLRFLRSGLLALYLLADLFCVSQGR